MLLEDKMENSLNSTGKFRSFSELPEVIILKIDKYLQLNNCLLIDEYEFHLSNCKDSYIIAGWSIDFNLEVFTIVKVDNFRINGLSYKALVSFMYEYFDYMPFFSIYNTKIINNIIKRLFKAERIQLIAYLNTASFIDNVSFYSKEDVYIYDSSLDKFEELLKKKSIKRKHNSLIKDHHVSFYHYDGDFTKDLINELAELHKERWAFDGVESSFINDAYRNAFYNYDSGNRLISVIRNNKCNEIIAVHYGFILNNSLLWHTPVINVKYYNYTPLEPLLKFMFEFCKDKNIIFFDLGLGSESYKDRFSNTKKNIYSYYFPIQTHSLVSFDILWRTVKIAKLFINNLKIAKNGISAFINKRNKIIYFELVSTETAKTSNIDFHIIEDWERFADLIRSFNLKLIKEDYLRIRSGNIFYCLSKQGKIVCSGWGANPKQFYVMEINKKIDFECDILLFDFITKCEFRNMGFYKSLLKRIVNDTSNIKYGIFVDKNNLNSKRGILSVGFSEIKSYKGW